MKLYKKTFGNTDYINTYVATLTHDLSTPISAQISALNLILDKHFGELNETQEKILVQIKDSCYYTKNLADNILYTYLYKEKPLDLELSEFDWALFLEKIILETYTLANENFQRIINYSDNINKPIIADKFQIKRVIINLVSNAIKYGNPNTNIEFSSKLDKNGLFFNIKNSSKYIKKDDINNIFEKFVTCHERYNSSGLGLYFVKEVINAHKGYVFADSKENGECVFGFYLPQ